MLKIVSKFVFVFLIISTSGILSIVSASNINERKIIVFKDSITKTRKTEILQRIGAEKIKNLEKINAIVIQLPKGCDIKSEGDIAYIEDDIIISFDRRPTTTPTYTQEPNEVIPWGIEYMGAPDIWGAANTDNIKVGIIDTGIDLDHPDLAENIKGSFNAINQKKSADDDNGHGTHVAGIIAAADNNIGVIGMMPDADIFAIKSLNKYGNGYISDIIEGIEWAINNKMDMVNMSIGTATYSQSLHDIVIKAYNAGIKLIAAAGNNFGGYSEYPAAFDEVISVGAINQSGEIANFSAIGGVNVFVPGVSIYSTYIGGGYTYMSGTSMASPHCIYQKN